MFKQKSPLYKGLKKNPGSMLVTDQYLAVLMPDDTVLAIMGDFKGISQEDANLKLQDALRKLQ